MAVHFLGKGWVIDGKLQEIIAFYAIGSFVGGFVARWLSDGFAISGRPTVRFSFHFVALAIFTIGFVVLLFTVQHRSYFSQWHEHFPSITWAFQVFFTGLGSIFLFAVTGLHPLLPWGLLGLFVASLLFSRGWPSRRR